LDTYRQAPLFPNVLLSTDWCKAARKIQEKTAEHSTEEEKSEDPEEEVVHASLKATKSAFGQG
jgi:hypothetical protein